MVASLDPVFAAEVGRLHPGRVLLQDRNDLLFRVPLRCIVWSFLKGQTSGSSWINSRGERQRLSARANPVLLLLRCIVVVEMYCGCALLETAGDPSPKSGNHKQDASNSKKRHHGIKLYLF
jgi:hypothetical protein